VTSENIASTVYMLYNIANMLALNTNAIILVGIDVLTSYTCLAS